MRHDGWLHTGDVASMHHVAILAVNVLQAANAHVRQQQGPNGRDFAWSFVSADGGAVSGSNGLQMATQPLNARALHDVVVVPAIHYPGCVDLQYKSVLTETDRLVCAGATATYLLQAIRIVERFMGPELASQCARSMLMDASQTGHIPYLPLLAPVRHSDSLVERAQHWQQQHMAEPVTMRRWPARWP